MKRILGRVAAFAMVVCAGAPAFAMDWSSWLPSVTDPYDHDVFFFAGRFEARWFPDALFPISAAYQPWFWENNFVLGGGYQQFFGQWNGIKFGAEAGASLRLSDDGTGQNSGEVWAGPVVRLPAWNVLGYNVSLAATGGLSAVSGTIGVETDRARSIGRDVPVLFYFGPEVDISRADNPNVEVFWRVQHRSGGYGIIAPIDGSNADTIGLRFKF
jgi:hypothetical protein